VSGIGTKGGEDGMNDCGITEAVGISLLAGHANDAVLHERAGEEAEARGRLNPMMGGVMVNMLRVKEGQQRVEIKEVAVQSTSSARDFTMSGVTVPALARTGKSGMPFRVEAGFGGVG